MDKNAVLEILSRFKKALESKGIVIDKIILLVLMPRGHTRKEATLM